MERRLRVMSELQMYMCFCVQGKENIQKKVFDHEIIIQKRIKTPIIRKALEIRACFCSSAVMGAASKREKGSVGQGEEKMKNKKRLTMDLVHCTRECLIHTRNKKKKNENQGYEKESSNFGRGNSQTEDQTWRGRGRLQRRSGNVVDPGWPWGKTAGFGRQTGQSWGVSQAEVAARPACLGCCRFWGPTCHHENTQESPCLLRFPPCTLGRVVPLVSQSIGECRAN